MSAHDSRSAETLTSPDPATDQRAGTTETVGTVGTATGPDLTRLVDAWAVALSGTSHTPMNSADVAAFLRLLTHRLVDTVRGHPFHAEQAYQVGVALVDAHFVGPEALGRSLRVISARLPGVAGTTGPAPAERLAAVQEAITTGYVQALRDRTLNEQESIRRADSNARQEIEEALRASETRFRTVFAEAGIGIGLADMENRIVEANQALSSMLGYTVQEFCQLRVTDIVHPDDAAGMGDMYQTMTNGKLNLARMEKRYRHRDGSAVWTNLTASLIRDCDGSPRYILVMVEDISERRLLEGRLRHQALHDPLTGLPNRALFFERLTETFTHPDARVGVCYLDLDGFKIINDTLGHHVGDELLVAVADRLGRCVPSRNHMVARMGGDEFVILAEHSPNTDDVTELATTALTTLEEPFDVAGHQLVVSASIGVVERPVAGTTPAEVMKAADSTLYWAKSDGRGRWALFEPDRAARETTRYTLAATMRTALEQDEFTIAYQPLVQLTDGTLRGVEALVRWRHPTLGTLGPNQFIGLAEETGLIVPLGRWVLEQACQQARQWQNLFPGTNTFVSVNLTVRQAWDPDIVTDVATILDRTGLAPELLQLELTESAVMGTAGRPLEALHALSAMGVRIAIDDFGTGYSNLAYLRWLPVHALKLAGPFVEGFRSEDTSDPVDELIITTLIRLAHTLGLTVTAECVENAQQAEQLRTIGCDTAQGWYFAHPAPPEEINHLLQQPTTTATATTSTDP